MLILIPGTSVGTRSIIWRVSRNLRFGFKLLLKGSIIPVTSWPGHSANVTLKTCGEKRLWVPIQLMHFIVGWNNALIENDRFDLYTSTSRATCFFIYLFLFTFIYRIMYLRQIAVVDCTISYHQSVHPYISCITQMSRKVTTWSHWPISQSARQTRITMIDVSTSCALRSMHQYAPCKYSKICIVDYKWNINSNH